MLVLKKKKENFKRKREKKQLAWKIVTKSITSNDFAPFTQEGKYYFYIKHTYTNTCSYNPTMKTQQDCAFYAFS